MTNTSIANNVRRIVQARGLKYTAVAAKAGMTPTQLSALLCGRRSLKADDISALINALDISPNEIFGYEEATAS